MTVEALSKTVNDYSFRADGERYGFTDAEITLGDGTVVSATYVWVGDLSFTAPFSAATCLAILLLVTMALVMGSVWLLLRRAAAKRNKPKSANRAGIQL